MRQLIPHFILEKFAAGERHGRLSAAALFVDLSGFTSFTDTLLQHRRDGAEVLSDTLARLFRPMIGAVYAAGGFISHFAGDAFLALFPDREQDAAGAAWDTALAIERILSDRGRARSWDTRYGNFTFHVTISLGYGDVEWGILGREDRYTYYARGPAVDECNEAQELAHQGEIVAGERFMARLVEPVKAATTANRSFFRIDWIEQVERLEKNTPNGVLEPNPQRPPAPERATLRPFVADAILDLSLPGEFRHVCPLFISFQAPAGGDALETFVADVIEQCHAHGGVFGRLEFGDKGSMMVVWFGAPVSHENDVARAVAFLLSLREKTEKEIPWRAGLTYGLVWAGIWGADERNEYSAFGSVVNLASHIATSAAWGEIWIDETAAPYLQESYRLVPLSPALLKGQSRPRQLFRLSHETRPGLLFRGPMVGRREELDEIREAIAPIFRDRFAGLVHIAGEAGIGKSRLAYEVQQQAGDRVTWLTCPADDILRQSLNPFRAMLRDALRQSAEQDTAQNREAFQTALDDLTGRLAELSDERASLLIAELERTTPLLANLLDLPWPDTVFEQMEPRLRFENTLIALTTFIQAHALRRPLILHIEDAHWLDADSSTLIVHLLRALEAYPVALLVTSRPDDDGSRWAPTGTADAPQAVITLDALSPEGVRDLCRQVLHKPASRDLATFLWEKSRGNPFFAEQFVLDLLERNLLVWDAGREKYKVDRAAEVDLPPNLTVLLVSRLDRLDAPVKQVVQTAAILGQRFEAPVLEAMLQEVSGVSEKLKQAAQKRVWTMLDDLRYLFKHALLRDAAYQMQPAAHRCEMHHKAATTLETLHCGEQEAFIEEIAFHYEKAYELGLTALRPVAQARLQQAGAAAKRRYETEAAVDAFSRALALTEGEEATIVADILLAREEVYAWRGQREAQQRDLEQLAQLDADLDESRLAAVALRRAAFYAYIPDFEQAIPLIRKAIDLAQAADDGGLQAEAYRQLGHVHFREREYEEALAAFHQALSLARAGGEETIVTQTLNGMGMALDEQGNLADARVCYEQALQIQHQAGDLAGENTTLTNLGWQAFMQEEFDRALAYYEQALAICRQTGQRVSEANGLANVGLLTFLHGDFEKAWQRTQAAVRLYRETDNRRGEANALNNLALIACYLGQPERAETLARQAIELALEWDGNGALAEGYLYLGHAHRLLGRLTDAQEAYKCALEARGKAHQGRLVEPLAGLAHTALLHGDLEAAMTHVETILPVLTSGDYAGLNELFWVYAVCYQALSRAEDNRAGALLEQAQTALHAQAQKIKDVGDRARFLEAFSVKSILC